MGLIKEYTELKWNPYISQWYESKGYVFGGWKETFAVRVQDLMEGSTARVQVRCDCCGILLDIMWHKFLKSVKSDGKYYCRKCASKLYGGEHSRITVLKKNGRSFEQWCIANNRQDVLDRWDYELNDKNPAEIGFSSNKKYYIKCPRGLHCSEQKLISNFVRGQLGSIDCHCCNSFAQWGIDNLGEDFLDKYWSIKNTVNPWEINKGTDKIKVWIKCQGQDKVVHDDYDMTPYNFTKAVRCPVCNESKGERYIRDFFNKKSIEYIPQKEFEGLVGLKSHQLSYDFYLPQYNLLIEYQGEFHDGKAKYQSKNKLKNQFEHDKRKREYAIKQGIELFEIWYWDYGKIEELLTLKLNI